MTTNNRIGPAQAQGEIPIFAYSPKAEIVSASAAFVFVLIATLYTFSSGGIALDVLNVAWIAFINIFLLYLIVTRWRLRLVSVQFYDERVVVKRSARVDEMKYSDVQKVSLSRNIWSGSRIRIESKITGVSLVIPKNLTNRRLKVDLYSWLRGKTTIN